MCGIVGVRHGWLARRTRDPEGAVSAAVEQLRWRGPDGVGVVRAGGWWLGCARLAITQARSRQPVVRRGGGFAAVLNGALTDGRALWGELLPGSGRRRQPPNDAWLPLLAVARGRLELLAGAAGHRAAAVVEVDSGCLYLAVDPAGEKPLFLAEAEGRLVAFASTLPALRALGIDLELGSAEVARWFRCGFAEAEGRAAGADLVRAAPRQAAVLRVGATGALEVAARAKPRAAVQEDLGACVRGAVARCTDLAVPAALALSGGIDSSCLGAALAGLGRRLPAYQFRAEGEPETERQLAARTARHCGLELRPVDGGPEVLEALPALTRQWGLPLGDPSLLAAHALARAAAQDGVRVLLAGEGCDELFLGYRRHRAARWLSRPRPWLGAWSRRLSAWKLGEARRLLRAAAAEDPYGELLAVAPPALSELVLAPGLAARGAAAASGSEPLAAARERDRRGYLRLDLLPKLDVATMAAGIEGRCPYLDPEVVAWVEARSAGEVLGKAPLRAAFRGQLPAAVFRQRKRGFALPLQRWFRGPLPWLDLLREPRTLARPHLRAAGVAEAIDRHRRGAADLGHGLYLLVAFELYLRAREEARACG